MRSLLLAACFAFLGSAFDPLNSSWALHRHGAAAQREFLGWLSGHARAVVGPLRLESEPGGVGLRAVASRAIAAGETLLAVPEEAGISVSGGWRHPVLAPLLRAAYAAARSGALPPRFAERLLRDDDLAAARAAHLHFLVFVEGARFTVFVNFSVEVPGVAAPASTNTMQFHFSTEDGAPAPRLFPKSYSASMRWVAAGRHWEMAGAAPGEEEGPAPRFPREW
jgi:hypothetical protein